MVKKVSFTLPKHVYAYVIVLTRLICFSCDMYVIHIVHDGKWKHDQGLKSNWIMNDTFLWLKSFSRLIFSTLHNRFGQYSWFDSMENHFSFHFWLDIPEGHVFSGDNPWWSHFWKSELKGYIWCKCLKEERVWYCFFERYALALRFKTASLS